MYIYIFSLILFIFSYQKNEKILVSNVLDNLHKYASQANGELYFDLFNDDAIFFGTDATERWSKSDFKNYAQERFDKGDGWTYYPISRNIFFNRIIK